MKIILSFVVLAAAITGCRTTEANYRAAYEAAVAGRDDDPSSTGIDNTVYDKIRREARPASVIADGDTVPARRERVRLTDAADGEQMQAAYLVVAQFKQLFNARSLRDRLRDGGYPDVTLLETREPLYYVAVGGGDNHAAAMLYRDWLAKPALPARDPYPLILQPVR